jgi:dTDP-4-amino-4,6-dideoxygalactose transaminase
MIRMNDFTSEPEELRRQELAAVERAFRSGRFILGNEVQRFEEAWAKFCGARFCIGVGNGMEAIELGLRALNIGPDDEIITTSMTAIATVLAIMHAGATPVLADIDLATALLDLQSVERCLTARTKAVLLVHLYGQIPAMDRWLLFVRKTRIHLLEDCAQAHGAIWNRQHAGVFGTWGAFSFYPTKNLGAKGDAGALVTSSEEITGRLKTLRNCGASERYEHPEVGLNSRLDEAQAAILSTRLNSLERFNARRQEIARKYFAKIDNPRIELLALPGSPQNHVYHLFVIRCTERDRLAEFLNERGIQTLIHYPIPAHRQGCCRHVRTDPHGLANAELHGRQCLSLPCHPQLREDEIESLITAINQFE